MTPQPANVRLADANDIPALYWHLMGDLQADNSLDIPEDPTAVLQTVKDCCTMDHAVAGIIDGPNGTILGSVGIRGVMPWFSKVTILSQVWIFVTPAARRGTQYADDLFQFCEWHRQDMSERAGYDMVFENTIWSMNRLPAKIRLWGRYGTQIGATFWSRGPAGEHREDIQQEFDNGRDGPSGPVGLQQPAPTGADDSEHASKPLQRPARRPADV